VTVQKIDGSIRLQCQTCNEHKAWEEEWFRVPAPSTV
jgi:hypothetical protein